MMVGWEYAELERGQDYVQVLYASHGKQSLQFSCNQGSLLDQMRDADENPLRMYFKRQKATQGQQRAAVERLRGWDET
jgi:hypothetical protein